MERLLSEKKLALLNDIDKLRSQGISQYVNLPQLIVCGDQSSGKSSVLEAISGIPFPTKDNLCTRFATEVILRHTSEVKVFVGIVPGPGRSDEEQTKFHAFRRDRVDLKDFAQLIEDAKVCMGVTSSNSAFCTDVLRLEISGPSQPHLTIVDLPGLIHSENKQQTAADIEIVQNMVYEYMVNRRSIILAVVSAKNDYANQIVLKLARQVDTKGARTMGLVTKPDTLSIGSESEEAFVNLARNMDVNFRFGWHVLKNRSYEEKDVSQQIRDDTERRFFDHGAWKTLARNSVGIGSLRDKLSEILFNQIRAELPTLIEDIDRRMDEKSNLLTRLGPNRVGPDQQRLFLLRIGQYFQEISTAALDGSYGHSFFGDPRTVEGHSKRLRAVIQKMNSGFAETIRLRGHQRRIAEGNHDLSNLAEKKKTISRGDFITEIQELLQVNRGRELPGMFNPLIVGDLFIEHSKPWEALARQHIFRIWQAVKDFLELLVTHLADESTSGALLSQVLDPAMDQKLKGMNAKLDEILGPLKTGHPITYNHYFTETIQKMREKRVEADMTHRLRQFLDHNASESVKLKNAKMPNLLSALVSNSEADMDRFACSEILDCMEAYYKVAMKSFVDNVTIYSVESCLVTNISSLFSPSFVLQMNQELVSEIAAEPIQIQSLREETKKELQVLQKGTEVCRKHVNRISLRSRESLGSKTPGFGYRPDEDGPDEDKSLSDTEGTFDDPPTDLPDTITISPEFDLVVPQEGSGVDESATTPAHCSWDDFVPQRGSVSPGWDPVSLPKTKKPKKSSMR